MTGLAVALFAFTPQQPAATMLPRPHAWQAGFALSDVSAISMTYPIDQPGIDILSQVAVDIEVRYLDGDVWRCPPQGRFSLVDADRNPAGETQFPSRTFTGKSWSWLLGMVRQAKLGGLNDRGEREFKNTTVAQAIGTLIDEAHAYGGVPQLKFRDETQQSRQMMPVAPGKSVLDILTAERDAGGIEWLMQPDSTGQGCTLVVYDTVGTDRSAGASAVSLFLGRDVVDAPTKRTIQDFASDVIVEGDGGRRIRLPNPAANLAYGHLTDYVSAGGLTELGELEVVAQARLDAGSKPRQQHTRAIRFDTAEFVPWHDYGLGDTLLGPDDTGVLIPLRTRQITLTFDQQGLGGNLVLGDRFSERILDLDRQVKQLGGGRIRGTRPADPRPPSAKPQIWFRETSKADPFIIGAIPFPLVQLTIEVTEDTMFIVGLTFRANMTAAGTLEGYFMLSGGRLPTELHHDVTSGWVTVGMPFLVPLVVENAHTTLDFYLSGPAGTVQRDHAEMFVQTTGAAGGIKPLRPDRRVGDTIRILHTTPEIVEGVTAVLTPDAVEQFGETLAVLETAPNISDVARQDYRVLGYVFQVSGTTVTLSGAEPFEEIHIDDDTVVIGSIFADANGEYTGDLATVFALLPGTHPLMFVESHQRFDMTVPEE